jgi:hypothetical protein
MDGVLKTLTAENAKKFAEYAEKREIKRGRPAASIAHARES